ncbi:MAG: N-formylglutamate amidohydrolase [Deltaproteobacteria bacterium]|nr:N-formylglutamate amidohydrolase [Deltaproteobacteria bacterium]
MKRPWFDLVEPSTGEAPVVVEVPHAGLFLPAEVLAALVAPARAIARDADLFVDELYEDAPAEGASLLVARTSRYVVDLNRAEDDVDAGVVVGDPRPARPHARGLVWRTTTDDEPALIRPLTREEYRFRLDAVHRPYHEALRSVLDRKIARFGYVMLLCAHSMPSVGRAGHADAGVPRADVVPGSRGRTSAHKRVIDAVEAVAVAHGRTVEHDRPYRGGWSTSHYGRPAQKCHAIQVELARRSYLDEQTLQRNAGLPATRKLCRALVARLASLPPDALT